MNILVLIRKLDQSPLEREVRSGDYHGDIISFYNESDIHYNLMIDNIEYNKVVQACIILKDHTFYLYIQHGEIPNLVKIDIDSIVEMSCFS